jgi:methylmalonyl-CoA mutase cobalamin-binding domain/chain
MADGEQTQWDELIDEVYDAILDGRHKETPALVTQALAGGVAPADLLNDGMIDAMAEVGRQFEAKVCFVPEMMQAARAMKSGLEVLRPQLQGSAVKAQGRVALGTVKGDMHDIGKNLVAMMLEGAGFEIVDLGVDVSSERFVAAAENDGVDIVGLSALITTTLPAMQQAVAALNASAARSRVKVVVGGAPVSSSFAAQIGADGFAPDASSAVTLAQSLLAH